MGWRGWNVGGIGGIVVFGLFFRGGVAEVTFLSVAEVDCNGVRDGEAELLLGIFLGRWVV